jgi:uncharacterized SAM-binding protein YcdF (DUF218 family)
MSEALYWRAARNEIENNVSGDGVVVVLGVSGNGPAGRAVQQWRVDLATKTWNRCHCKKVIFTGGATRSKNSEASQMASIARLSGMDPTVIVLEENSQSTWENVVEASRMAEGARTVVLVSDAFHASRARRYWNMQHPDLTQDLQLADHYAFLDHFWLRTPATLVELLHRNRNG